MNDLKERLTELEIGFAFQRETVEELNRLVTAFGRRLDLLERENGRLREMVRSLSPELPASPDE